jgi:hypothetical protein
LQVGDHALFVDDFSPGMIDVQSRMFLNELLVFCQAAGQESVVVAHADDIVAGAITEADVPVVHHVDSTAVLLIAIIAYAAVGKERFDDGT